MSAQESYCSASQGLSSPRISSSLLLFSFLLSRLFVKHTEKRQKENHSTRNAHEMQCCEFLPKVLVFNVPLLGRGKLLLSFFLQLVLSSPVGHRPTNRNVPAAELPILTLINRLFHPAVLLSFSEQFHLKFLPVGALNSLFSFVWVLVTVADQFARVEPRTMWRP